MLNGGIYLEKSLFLDLSKHKGNLIEATLKNRYIQKVRGVEDWDISKSKEWELGVFIWQMFTLGKKLTCFVIHTGNWFALLTIVMIIFIGIVFP